MSTQRSTRLSLEVWAHPVSFAHATSRETLANELREAGVGIVRLAYAYHSGRWLLTTSIPGTVAQLPAGMWFGSDGPYSGTIQPFAAAPGRLATHAARSLKNAGLAVTAWVVGLHSTALASAHPQFALRNVFGDIYRHALCPAQPAVIEYARSLVADVSRQPEVSALDLEAFGYLGWTHDGAHNKVGAELRAVDRWLLSLCFCAACDEQFGDSGLDVPELKNTINMALRSQLSEPHPDGNDIATDAEQILGEQVLAAILRVRATVTNTLLTAVMKAAGALPVSLRVTGDPFGSASKTAGNLEQLADIVGGLTVTDFNGNFGELASELRAAQATSANVTAGWSLGADHTPTPERLMQISELTQDSGATALAFYCFDLMPHNRLTWLRNDPHLQTRRVA